MCLSSMWPWCWLATYRQAPVHPQVDRHQYDVYRKDVHFLGPAADSIVTGAPQLGKEEGVEGVSGGQVGLFTALHQQVHVEINNLKWRKYISQALKSLTNW